VRRLSLCFVPLCGVVAIMAMIWAMASSAPGAPGGPDDPDGPSPALPPSLPPDGSLAAAVAATRAVASARVELRTTIEGRSTPLTFIHRAAFDRPSGRAEAATDMSGAARALAAAGEPLDGDWSEPTRVVVDGETVYSQLGPMAESLGRAPTDWTSAQVVTVVARGATDNDTLALALDPLGPLDLLERPVVASSDEGVDDLHGVPAARLRATLALGGPTPDGATDPSPGSFEARLVAAGIAELPVDVWLDEAGAVRRLVVRVDGALLGREDGPSMTTTFDVHAIGEPVEVEVPDPGDVVDDG